MPYIRSHRSRHTLFFQGEATPRIYCVSKGLIRAYTIHENGDDATIAFFGPGDFLPVETSYGIAPVTLFHYETLVDSELMFYTQKEFEQYLAGENDEMKRFPSKYMGALLHINALAQQSATLKVAHTLRYLAVRFGEKTILQNHKKITIKLTQHDLARLCNLTRETVSGELVKLRKAGLVNVKEKYYFVNLVKLDQQISDGLLLR